MWSLKCVQLLFWRRVGGRQSGGKAFMTCQENNCLAQIVMSRHTWPATASPRPLQQQERNQNTNKIEEQKGNWCRSNTIHFFFFFSQSLTPTPCSSVHYRRRQPVLISEQTDLYKCAFLLWLACWTKSAYGVVWICWKSRPWMCRPSHFFTCSHLFILFLKSILDAKVSKCWLKMSRKCFLWWCE